MSNDRCLLICIRIGVHTGLCRFTAARMCIKFIHIGVRSTLPVPLVWAVVGLKLWSRQCV